MTTKTHIVECTYVNQQMVYESLPVSTAEDVFPIIEELALREHYAKGALIGRTPTMIVNYPYDDGVAALNIFKTETGWMSTWSITRYRRWIGLPMPSKTIITDFKERAHHASLRAEIEAGFIHSVEAHFLYKR